MPSPLSVKAVPAGSGPVTVRAGAGDPVAVTVNEPPAAAVTAAPAALVIAGAVPTVRVKAWVAADRLLVAVRVTG